MNLRNLHTMLARGLHGRKRKVFKHKSKPLRVFCPFCEIHIPEGDCISLGAGFYEHWGALDGGNGCGKDFTFDYLENKKD